jgi:acyl-CoA thioester hydrolase
MSEPSPSCDVQIRVRYAETDAMGYLHHAQYFVYFELGRTELLRQNGLRYRDMEQRGLFYVVARLDCRFRAPAHYDDLLTLTTSTAKLSPLRVDHRYELKRDGRLLAQGNSTLVLVGRDGKPTLLPDDLYNILRGTAPSQLRTVNCESKIEKSGQCSGAHKAGPGAATTEPLRGDESSELAAR